MAFPDELATLKSNLKAARISVDEMLAVAGVNRSTWTRWHKLHMPRLERWQAVQAAADKLLAERSRTTDRAA